MGLTLCLALVLTLSLILLRLFGLLWLRWLRGGIGVGTVVLWCYIWSWVCVLLSLTASSSIGVSGGLGLRHSCEYAVVNGCGRVIRQMGSSRTAEETIEYQKKLTTYSATILISRRRGSGSVSGSGSNILIKV